MMEHMSIEQSRERSCCAAPLCVMRGKTTTYAIFSPNALNYFIHVLPKFCSTAVLTANQNQPRPSRHSPGVTNADKSKHRLRSTAAACYLGGVRDCLCFLSEAHLPAPGADGSNICVRVVEDASLRREMTQHETKAHLEITRSSPAPVDGAKVAPRVRSTFLRPSPLPPLLRGPSPGAADLVGPTRLAEATPTATPPNASATLDRSATNSTARIP